MAAIVSLRGLGKIYESRGSEPVEALVNITFDVAEGEIVSIIGPSGCGKSTLLKILSGILTKSNGNVLVEGTEVSGPSESMSMMFQTPVLFPWLTVRQNILVPVEVRGRNVKQYAARVDDLLRLTGLHGFGERHPRELSGGMQQRAALCRALILDPKILLMDEPFGALDALTRERMTVELLRLWETSRKTIFFVTHSIPEAVFLSHRVVLLSGRPGMVDQVFDIDMPIPRSVELMSTPQFARLTGQIRERLYSTDLDE